MSPVRTLSRHAGRAADQVSHSDGRIGQTSAAGTMVTMARNHLMTARPRPAEPRPQRPCGPGRRSMRDAASTTGEGGGAHPGDQPIEGRPAQGHGGQERSSHDRGGQGSQGQPVRGQPVQGRPSQGQGGQERPRSAHGQRPRTQSGRATAGQAGPRRPPQPRAAGAEQLGLDLEGMPQPLFVCTPSKLTAYEDCPRRYRHTYVDRPAPPKGPAWAHNSLGASVHTALRSWYALPAPRRQPAELARLLRATWVSDGYRDRAQEESAFSTALGWLEPYVSALDPGDEPIGVERVVAVKTATLALSGRVDRIDLRAAPDPAGGGEPPSQRDELVIVDYKTGRSGLSTDDARGSLALALYAYAAERVFRRSCRRVELHHLPTGTVASHTHTEESLTRHLDRATATARDITAAQRATAEGADPDECFPMTPGALCSWCDFRRHCPAGLDAPAREPWAGLSLPDPG